MAAFSLLAQVMVFCKIIGHVQDWSGNLMVWIAFADNDKPYVQAFAAKRRNLKQAAGLAHRSAWDGFLKT
jgi:hypothetical protein